MRFLSCSLVTNVISIESIIANFQEIIFTSCMLICCKLWSSSTEISFFGRKNHDKYNSASFDNALIWKADCKYYLCCAFVRQYDSFLCIRKITLLADFLLHIDNFRFSLQLFCCFVLFLIKLQATPFQLFCNISRS